MHDLVHDRLLSTRFLWIKAAAAGYVVALIAAHCWLQARFVWETAVVFSVAMNVTYPYAAWRQSRSQPIEWLIAGLLSLLSAASLIASPLFVISAVFLHGGWDIAKHRGAGAPFFAWYTLGCVAVDWLYGSALVAYYLLK